MMKKITKFVTLLLALAMVFSLAACSSGKGKDMFVSQCHFRFFPFQRFFHAHPLGSL